MRGGSNQGDRRFLSRVVGVVDVWRDFNQGMGPDLHRVRQDLDVGSRGNSRSALALLAPANQ